MPHTHSISGFALPTIIVIKTEKDRVSQRAPR